MAISRSLMNRQLRANGGIMDVTPRENFGLGSSLKKFVRKIIPNEVAEIATKAAPFVAPFNPLLAAGMSGIGTFDQTGSIGDSLKAGGMNYALGQGARYIGGGAQNLQTGFNPFSGYNASAGLTRGLLTNPVSDQGGLGKLFSNQGTQGVQGIGAEPQSIEGFLTQDAAKNVGLESERLAELASQTQNQFIKNSPSAMDSFKSIISFDTSAAEKGNAALDLLKKGGQAAFTKPGPDGKPMLDKAAVMGAIAFAGSYAEALALAEDAGVELTEEAYDEARKTEKKEEYAGYLTNFYGGKKDGGRIGYEQGANELIMEKLTEDIMPDTSTEEMIMIMTEDGPKMIKKSDYEAMSGMFRDTTTSLYGDAARGRPVPEFANGGRIGRRFGSPEEGEGSGLMEMLSVEVDAGGDDEEDMLMAYTPGFSSQEKSYLFRRMGASGGAERSYTMPQLYRILKNPGDYPEDAAVLKEIAVMGLGKKDGGRIGLKDGTGSSNRVAQLMLERDYLLSKDEDVSFIDLELERDFGIQMKAEGGIMEAKVPTGQMRKNNAGVAERDYRQTGGFVPVGIKERADDVPAMLSKNEFVMTADAVRGLGNGSVEEGSKKLYNTMKQAEQVGKA